VRRGVSTRGEDATVNIDDEQQKEGQRSERQTDEHTEALAEQLAAGRVETSYAQGDAHH
jgi:hypothetical protein